MYRKVFLILFFIALPAVLQAQTTNLVINPSFENGSGTNPDGWSAVRKGDMELTWPKTIGHTGNASICVSNVQSGSSLGSHWISDFINVEPGTVYDFSYWTYITKLFAATQWYNVLISMCDTSGTEVYTWGVTCTNKTPDQWVSQSTKILMHSEAVKIKIKAYFENQQLPYSGSIYLDDVEMKKSSPTVKFAVLSPVQHEVLPAKAKYDIKWNSENIPFISIGVDYFGGSGWKYFTDINGAAATYKWTVPDTEGYCNMSIKDQLRDIEIIRFCQIVRPALNITFPSGGENFNGGTVRTLSWNNTAMNSVKLEYSTNYGSVWIKIADSVKSQTGTYQWTVPVVSSSQCLIRVSDAVYETGTAAVSKTFSINSTQSADNLVLNPSFESGTGLKPDNWSMQNPADLKMVWTDTLGHSGRRSIGLGDLKKADSILPGWSSDLISIDPSIVYAIKFWSYGIKMPETGQGFNISINYFDSAGTAMHSIGYLREVFINRWTNDSVTFKPAATAAKISISVTLTSLEKVFSGFAYFDDFELIPKSPLTKLRLIAPEGGQKLAAGSQFDIKWEAQNVSKLNIYYNPKFGISGSTYVEIAKGIPANTGSYRWTVPDSVTTTCNFRIEDPDNLYISSYLEWNNLVTIYKTSFISLTSPAGGETWTGGSMQKIKWSSYLVNRIKLEYSTDNGASWKLIADSVDALTQEYLWTVPVSPSSLCKVKISCIDDSAVFCINQNPFKIEKNTVSAINIVSPNGGEIWQTGTVQQILWAAENVAEVNIDFSSDNGGSWERIATNVKGADGRWSWNINKSESQKCQIRLTDASNSLLFSKSASDFVLYSQPANITLSYTAAGTDVNKASSFRMIGVPGVSNYPVSQILKGNNKSDWQAFYDNGGSQDYMVAYDGSSAFNLRPGAGFWIISKNPITVGGTIASVAVNDSGCYKIPLNKGWNIISNPFEKSIPWSKVQASNLFNESLWDFNGSFSSASVMEPYKGYYIYNAGNLTGLKIPYAYPADMAQSRMGKGIGKEIKLKLYSGGKERSDAVIGFSNLSRRGKDTLDIYKPVSDFESERIVIRNEELNGNYKFLYSDFRTECDTQSYDLRIRLVPNESYVLRYEGMLENETGIILIDERLGNMYDLTETGEAMLKSAFEENKFRLVTGKKSILKEIKNTFTSPLNFSLENNFPNPFNPGTVIAYSVTDPGDVILKVYDIQGREIAELVNEFQNAGRYSVQFSIKDKELSSGIYIYTLQSGGKKQSKKMMLVK